MIEFFAPWCPACRHLNPVWEDFATWSLDLGIKVGQVDITSSPGLSGRFMITALPTIYHVKDKQFRPYRGPRSKDDFLLFIEEKRWQSIEPISTWYSPDSLLMGGISGFYRISMEMRNLLTVLTDTYGIPVWATYLLCGGVTIAFGLALGMFLVICIDFFYPQKPFPRTDRTDTRDTNRTNNDDETEDLEDDLEEDINKADTKKTK